jgi:hypothetical protein
LLPRWPEPHFKARTSGSDDHGLLNVGKTWTEFPHHVKTTDDLLHCIRKGDCRPGGAAGSSAKLAHTFYSVAVRYYTRHILSPKKKPNLATALLQTLSGDRTMPGKVELARLAIRGKLRKFKKKILGDNQSRHDYERTDLIRNLFLQSAKTHFRAKPQFSPSSISSTATSRAELPARLTGRSTALRSPGFSIPSVRFSRSSLWCSPTTSRFFIRIKNDIC